MPNIIESTIEIFKPKLEGDVLEPCPSAVELKSYMNAICTEPEYGIGYGVRNA